MLSLVKQASAKATASENFSTDTTAGLPVALSKLVSESYALGRTRQAHRTFRVSLSVFLVLGVASFALMWWGSDLLAGFLNNPRASYGIRALAPAVVCVGCLSAFRGYAQGRQYMTPTAVSQIIEAVSKLFIGLGLSMYVVSLGYEDYIAAAEPVGSKALTEGHELPFSSATIRNEMSELEDMGYATTGDLEPIENFYLDPTGITFYYNVYEIAPYVMGATKITLSYEDITHLMNSEFVTLSNTIKAGDQ